jgi:hypothetical protein
MDTKGFSGIGAGPVLLLMRRQVAPCSVGRAESGIVVTRRSRGRCKRRLVISKIIDRPGTVARGNRPRREEFNQVGVIERGRRRRPIGRVAGIPERVQGLAKEGSWLGRTRTRGDFASESFTLEPNHTAQPSLFSVVLEWLLKVPLQMCLTANAKNMAAPPPKITHADPPRFHAMYDKRDAIPRKTSPRS